MAAEEQNRASDIIRLCDGRIIRLPAIMGVLNVTPDSFYDGGRYLDPDRAADRAFQMAAEGAAIIDIGGESSRPGGAHEVPPEAELARLLPVIQRLYGRLEIPISIDTRKAAVARVLLDSGAAIINDVSALSFDPAMAQLVAEQRSAVVLMHMKGDLANHPQFASYQDVVGEVQEYLSQRASFAVRAGIEPAQIILDPGIGFAKTAEHNLTILASLRRFCVLGYPVLIGASRKRFVRMISGESESDTLFGTAAANAIALANGAAIVRVHDVQAAAAVSRMAHAIKSAEVTDPATAGRHTRASSIRPVS
jgi:dihydropteroate synthase